MTIPSLHIAAYTATTACGRGKAELLAHLSQSRSGLQPNDFGDDCLPTWIGRVADVEDFDLPTEWSRWDCRNNRLAWLGLQQDGFVDQVAAARARYGAHRVAVIMGTSTSSIGASEQAYRELTPEGAFPEYLHSTILHTPHSLGDFVQGILQLSGPSVTVATACSSSAKVFAQAERLIRLGLVDAAVVGGVDTLCGSVLFGFNSLALVATEPCKPFDVARNGISIGEAAGFALLERGAGPLRLLGYGESSDAYHMSTPHPQGLGAEFALDQALERAGVREDQIDYINLHGTASTKNDEVEAALIARRFGPQVHASSTKGFTGHTLGAAGIVEAAICLLAIEHGFMPGTVNTTQLDPICGPQIRLDPSHGPVRHALSNSFGFGGNNCVLVFAAETTA